MKLGGFEQE